MNSRIVPLLLGVLMGWVSAWGCSTDSLVGVPCLTGLTPCQDGCFDLERDPWHCGGCDLACDTDQVCLAGECSVHCEDIDLQSDPEHCGQCGFVCQTGVCVDGECQDAEVGHLVAIGHDYFQSHPVLDRVIGNSIFMARTNPVEVLAYLEFADGNHVTNVDGAIAAEARLSGRAWRSTTAATAAAVAGELLNYDVLLVYHQALAQDVQLDLTGRSWAPTLDGFFKRGGIVVFLDAVGDHRGTWQLFAGAGLFSCNGLSDRSGATALVVAKADALARGVTAHYPAEPNSAAFLTGGPGIVVVDQNHGDPLVLHWPIEP